LERTVVDGRYDVVRPLGGGGMGEVYLARDQILDRDVALKVLRRQYAGDSEFTERFKREALNAASLSHPNIVQIYDRGETTDGAAYIAMEYVPGGTLKERITRGEPLALADVASIGAQVAEALGAAHTRGVIHRDIKPQNILLTAKGEAKVGDFGIARGASAITLSETGSVMGTVSYMSPEQAMGEPATPRSDLYALGVVLYEAITGGLPYTADNPIAVSMKHVNEPLRPPKEVNPAIPDDMNALVVTLLAKNPEDRYADATQLADDLWKVRRGLGPAATGLAKGGERAPQFPAQATTVEAPAPATRPKKRRALPIPIMLLALLALIGLGWVLSLPFYDFGFEDLLGGPALSAEVPSVEGLTKDKAVQKLDAAGFGAEVRERESSAADAGLVLDQTPPAGQSARKGSQVVLVVSAVPPTVEVPQVVGLSLPEAEVELDRAGLGVGSQNEFPSQTAPEGQVVEQSLQPGVEVDPRTLVDLGISSGPPASGDPASSASSFPSASASSSASPATSSAASAPASNPPSAPAANSSSAEASSPVQSGGKKGKSNPEKSNPEKSNPEKVQPTAVQPTAVEPTAVEPTAVEPTAVEPTAVEPTAVEPTAVEPTAVGGG
jgi:eukaryotic-like serine/threonine-protein kinase